MIIGSIPCPHGRSKTSGFNGSGQTAVLNRPGLVAAAIRTEFYVDIQTKTKGFRALYVEVYPDDVRDNLLWVRWSKTSSVVCL